ncbi:MAG: Type secretion system pilin [Patescibacteria group bacterium]|nr:Type secretion system pilin [Patescibacteria group bacterium]
MKKSFLLALFSLLIFPIIAVSQASGQLINNPQELEKMTTETGLAANLGKVEIGQIAARGIQVILGFLAIIFLSLTIVSGFRWMTAGGNEETIKKAQGTITSAIIGLVIVLAAYTITYFVFANLPFGSSPAGGITTSG